MFTKTSLNKIKKADLVQMYLDLQAKDYDEKMEETLEKCCNNAIEEVVKSMKDVIEEVKAENEKLKEEIEMWHKALDEPVEGLENLQSGINLHFWKRCKGPWNCDQSEEEEYKIEINVVGLGFCRYIDEEDRDKKVVYCKNDCWKIRGDKTAKDEEGNYCETDEEED
jgi:chromosome segregation ATPase